MAAEELPQVVQPQLAPAIWALHILGGSWDLVSKVISTLSGVISNYKYGYLIYNPVTKSHDPPRKKPSRTASTAGCGC